VLLSTAPRYHQNLPSSFFHGACPFPVSVMGARHGYNTYSPCLSGDGHSRSIATSLCAAPMVTDQAGVTMHINHAVTSHCPLACRTTTVQYECRYRRCLDKSNFGASIVFQLYSTVYCQNQIVSYLILIRVNTKKAGIFPVCVIERLCHAFEWFINLLYTQGAIRNLLSLPRVTTT
jgi:hypothetical protein